MDLDLISMKGKTAVVTGARRHLGKEFALLLAEAGADVAVADVVTDDGQLEATAGEIEALGRRSLLIKADVTRKSDVENMVQKVVDSLGDIDILINNAGISSRMTLMQTTEEEWDAVVDTDLKGTFLCAQAVGWRMIQQGKGGSIINLSSATGVKGNITRGAYSVAKSAVIMLTKLLAIELGQYNIRVNAVVPGFTTTGKIGGRNGQMLVRSPEQSKEILTTIPLRRFATPQDYAKVVLFLASDAAGYVTGGTYCVDGGSTIT